MKTIIISVLFLFLFVMVSNAQVNNLQQTGSTTNQKEKSIYFRGFNNTGNLKNELTKKEYRRFNELMTADTSLAQMKNNFEHPNKELAPIMKKISEKTKSTLLTAARFGEGPARYPVKEEKKQ